MEGMYHGEILSSFLLWGKGTNKMASIKMILYIPYISYIFRIFAKKGNYGSNSYTSKKDY